VSDAGTRPGERIAELIASIAPFLDDVTAATEPGGRTVYRRGGTEIAHCDAQSLEVRLPPDIAEAATRTPDTVALDGAPGWIRFTPRSDERHVGDRAEAWFRTAWRHAGEGGGSGTRQVRGTPTEA
jgi:hypothetical protein